MKIRFINKVIYIRESDSDNPNLLDAVSNR